MTRIKHKYIVCKELLEKIEKYVQEKNPTFDELMAFFHRSKIQYQIGLAHLDD